MNNNQEFQNENLPAVNSTTAMVAIEQNRATQEVQASLIVAKKYPRDSVAAYNNLMEACKRPSLAKSATYSYKRGNAIVSDGSIRLAEVMAQTYGNLDFGVREIERRPGISICESYCWDLQTNTKQRKQFEVPHEMKANGTMKILTDPRDIYELVANNGARRLRACIFGIIPADFKEGALNQVRLTMGGDMKNRPLGDVIREMVVAFKSHFQVTQEMIEAKLGHAVAEMSQDEVLDYTGIFNSLKDKHSKRSDWFDFGSEGATKSDLNEKLKNQAAPKKEEPNPEAGPATAIAPGISAAPVEKPVVKNFLQERAGNLYADAWPEYKAIPFKSIPEDELLKKLSEIETRSHQGKISEVEKTMYANACQYLNRKQNLKV